MERKIPRSPDLQVERDLIDVVQRRLTRPRPEPAIGFIDIGGAGDDNTIAPDWANGWGPVTGTTPGFYVGADGRVRWRGRITGGDVGTEFCTPLPEGWRPAEDATFIVPNDAGGYCHVLITATGHCSVIAIGASVVVSS